MAARHGISIWNGPKGIAYAPDGSLYISDTENYVIRRVSLSNGTVPTVAEPGCAATGRTAIRSPARWRGRTASASMTARFISGIPRTTAFAR